MITEDFIRCIEGKGPLQAEITLPPIERVQLRPNVLLELVSNKNVIHLGCTDHIALIEHKIRSGTYLHTQLTQSAAKCIGIDIDDSATQFARQFGIDNILTKDITQPDITEIKAEAWDYLIMSEILEHVDNPVDFLRTIGRNYKDHINSVVITVPNAFGLIHFSQAAQFGRESVNSDHRYWFTPYTICKVVYEAGLQIDDMTMCCYENSAGMLTSHAQQLMEKPILLDTIVLICHWE